MSSQCLACSLSPGGNHKKAALSPKNITQEQNNYANISERNF